MPGKTLKSLCTHSSVLVEGKRATERWVSVFIPDDKVLQVRNLIDRFFATASEKELLESLLPELAKVVPSDIYGLVLFPIADGQKPVFASNNTLEFMQLYTDELAQQDIFTEYMVEHGNSIAFLKDVASPDVRRSNCFLNECERLRPTSDGGYFPIEIEGYLSGFYAVARLAGNPRPYSVEEIKLLAFLSSFLPEAIERAVRLPPPEDDAAYIDGLGRVVEAGPRMKEVLRKFVGKRHFEKPAVSEGVNGKRFASRIDDLMQGPYTPRGHELTFREGHTSQRIIFTKLNGSMLRPYLSGGPQVQIRLADCLEDSRRRHIVAAAERFSLTPRETEVVALLYRGFSNREIACRLAIEEATVKHHLYNIFNKVGVDSRTHLLFQLAETDS